MMHWFRSNIRIGARVALFALAYPCHHQCHLRDCSFKRCNFRHRRRHQMTDVTQDRDQDGVKLSAADEQVLRELGPR